MALPIHGILDGSIIHSPGRGGLCSVHKIAIHANAAMTPRMAAPCQVNSIIRLGASVAATVGSKARR